MRRYASSQVTRSACAATPLAPFCRLRGKAPVFPREALASWANSGHLPADNHRTGIRTSIVSIVQPAAHRTVHRITIRHHAPAQHDECPHIRRTWPQSTHTLTSPKACMRVLSPYRCAKPHPPNCNKMPNMPCLLSRAPCAPMRRCSHLPGQRAPRCSSPSAPCRLRDTMHLC